MPIELTDDGTFDTVLRCSECGEEMRYNYEPDDTAIESAVAANQSDGQAFPKTNAEDDAYDRFVDWAIEDAESEHECPAVVPNEPEEGDITTSDHQTFYQDGKPVFEVAETVDGAYMLLINGFQVGGKVDRSGAGNATYPTVEKAIQAYMDRSQFWPNCWFISDHGNAHLISFTEDK